jgi:hypothetical protein
MESKAKDEIKIQTGNHLIGMWYSETMEGDVKHTTLISINLETLVINWQIADIHKESKSISSNAHWYNDFLMFMKGQQWCSD